MEITNTFIIPIIHDQFIGKCLQTLYETTKNYNVIIIDQTHDIESQSKYDSMVHLWIRPYRNLGFSKAMNIGIQLAQTPYITLLNDDVEFLNSNWWQGILDTFAMDKRIIAVNPNSPKEGAWGYGLTTENNETWIPPKGFIRDPNDDQSVIPDNSGKGKDFYETQEGYEWLLNSHPQWKKNTLCDAIAMWCAVFKRRGLQQIGLLDERFYPGSGEDYDMNCRAYSKELRMVGTTKSWVWHHWGQSKDLVNKDHTGLFTSREQWNKLDVLWGEKFDVWGHENMPDGTKKPLQRKSPIFIDEL